MFPPLINDITTTFPQAPEFQALRALNPGIDYKYKDKFYSEQTNYYNDLAPLRCPFENREQCFQSAMSVAKQMPRWEILAFDEASGRIEVTATTAFLKFKDDVVIELRDQAFHMRSKSRVGKGDFGANAKRIRTFFRALRSKWDSGK